ncbi:exodeoxyribonuclease VII large subunit [Bowmanella dokdonensis]|uniref:Exodeoxyribonuclease 7 large subunit n=1 Tax=Bowmanella dokdonensis TaxID=751969 RepID=A0A939DP72_9ALTE|nr:exodeoxyribonuclease VII large subunit [Bowmanella dokdonensis]MBN7826414.1 exodeoxyribonuclease VII large subunit [Bowmanella dokdonensis]
MPSNQQTIYTVSRLNRHARQVLESEIGQVWVRAEISNFVAAGSGHWYFTLKDDRAQVRAAMFRNTNRRVSMRPREGDRVLVRAAISLYEPRGDYQLIVEHMEPEGEGLLKQQFEQLKHRLLSEGLFDAEHKKPLPHPILRVGIVTSPTGAALHDILTVLRRRNPAIEVILYPSQVQGGVASSQLIQAIETANRRKEVDVLIVGRGGGSLEDLWCFNDEMLARCIFASTLPIISAVGHEVDVSIADFVADMRAPTPSAAAELVSQDKLELQKRVEQCQHRLARAFGNFLKTRQYLHHRVASQLERYHPQTKLRQQAQHLDGLSANLHHLWQRRLNQLHSRMQGLEGRLARQSPGQRLEAQQQRLTYLRQSLQRGWQQLYQSKQHKLAGCSHLLDTVSPLATLARGYSISLVGRRLITRTDVLQPGDQMITRLIDGEVSSKVTAIRKR